MRYIYYDICIFISRNMVFNKFICSKISGQSLSRVRIAEAQIVVSVFLAGITFVIDRFAMINGLGLSLS